MLIFEIEIFLTVCVAVIAIEIWASIVTFYF